MLCVPDLPCLLLPVIPLHPSFQISQEFLLNVWILKKESLIKLEPSLCHPVKPLNLLWGMSSAVYCHYSLFAPETQAVEKHIGDPLAAGIIQPLSPTGAGSFFVDKKDKSLRSCTDYWDVSDITVKSIPSAFELLQWDIFLNLDPRNSYYMVCIKEGDELKTVLNASSGRWGYLMMPFSSDQQ